MCLRRPRRTIRRPRRTIRRPRQTILAPPLTAVIAFSSCGAAMAASSSDACTNTLIGLSPCLDYISGNATKPSSSCCSKVSNVAGSQPQCLCEVLNGGGSSLGLNINQTQAEALPGACNLKKADSSLCKAASPSGSSNGTSSGSGGSKNVPSTDDGTSDGNSIRLTFSLLFFMLSVATLAIIL